MYCVCTATAKLENMKVSALCNCLIVNVLVGEAPARAVISGEDDTDEPEDDGTGNTAVYQKFNRILHGGSKRREIISIPFVQKYLLYAKNRCKPRLSEEAR